MMVMVWEVCFGVFFVCLMLVKFYLLEWQDIWIEKTGTQLPGPL